MEPVSAVYWKWKQPIFLPAVSKEKMPRIYPETRTRARNSLAGLEGAQKSYVGAPHLSHGESFISPCLIVLELSHTATMFLKGEGKTTPGPMQFLPGLNRL